MPLTPASVHRLKLDLQETELEHQDLKRVIEIMLQGQDFNELQICRLKKRKLLLKDKIVYLKNALIPNLDA